MFLSYWVSPSCGTKEKAFPEFLIKQEFVKLN